VVIALDHAGVGCGVGAGVGAGDAGSDGLGAGDADGAGEALGAGEGDGSGEAVVTSLADRGFDGPGQSQPMAPGANDEAGAGPTAARAGDAATASASAANRPAPASRAGRRAGALGSSRAIDMLRVWVWPSPPAMARKAYGLVCRSQHGTLRGTVPTMSRVMLGHGAWGSPASMAPWIDGLRLRGLDGGVVTLPPGAAGRAVPAFARQVPDEPDVVIGGHSMGGRVATLLAAAGPAGPDADGERPRQHALAGVVALSFPLHPPRRPDPALGRAVHWPAIEVPVLLLSGDADPYARIDLLRAASERLPSGRLVVYPGLGHDLTTVREDVLDRVAAFVREVATIVR
jgi:uncharacterized protein